MSTNPTDKPVPTINEVNQIYFEGTAIGELRVRHCPKCDYRFRFAHSWCINCYNQDLSWEKVSGKGKVTNFTIVHQPPYLAFDDVSPYVLALIQLDEGVRMMSNVIGCPPDDVHIGLPVKVVFEQRDDVALPMFVPDR